MSDVTQPTTEKDVTYTVLDFDELNTCILWRFPAGGGIIILVRSMSHVCLPTEGSQWRLPTKWGPFIRPSSANQRMSYDLEGPIPTRRQPTKQNIFLKLSVARALRSYVVVRSWQYWAMHNGPQKPLSGIFSPFKTVPVCATCCRAPDRISIRVRSCVGDKPLLDHVNLLVAHRPSFSASTEDRTLIMTNGGRITSLASNRRRAFKAGDGT